MGTKFDLPPDAHMHDGDREERMGRETLEEWTKKQSPENRLALGIDGEGELWIAERKGATVEISRPGQGVVRTVEAPLTDAERPGLSQPRLLGSELLVGGPDGLSLGDKVVLPGLFDCYDGARHGGSCVLLTSGTPQGGEPGTYVLRWLDAESAPQLERVADPSDAVSVSHDPDRIGLAWANTKGIHTAALQTGQPGDVKASVISYYSKPDELYTAPSVAVDQTGKPYALFYLFNKDESGAWKPTREMQLNFERIAFKASVTPDGHFPINLIHRKRIYMVYGLKPNTSTARWRVPGTTMWDGAEQIPGSFPQAATNGKLLFIATDSGLYRMGGGEKDEGLDLLKHSWASPEGDVGPQNTFKAKLKRWFGF